MSLVRPPSHVTGSSGRRVNPAIRPASYDISSAPPPASQASGRRLNNAGMPGSGRRVNFDEKAAAFGSARRSKDSAIRRDGSMQISGSQQSFQQLSESQQSATESAISMNHLFSEARREIRRGHAADKQQEKAAAARHEYQKPGTETDEVGRVVSPITKDIEAGGVPEVVELNFATDVEAIKDMLRESYILSCMLLCIPIGFLAYFTNFGGESATFIFNFLAIIPLAWLLGNATEELAIRSNQTVGGLLNATFGNAVELIVSVIALRKGMIKLVQTSLLGSILSNCLLVLGMSFALGGIKNKVQVYNQKGAHMLSSLLLLASIALVLPAAFVNSFVPHPTLRHLLVISRVTALLMFIIYLLYLFFQLYTHSEMFSDEVSNQSSESGSESGDVVNPLPGGAARKKAGSTRAINGTEENEVAFGLGGNSYQGAPADGHSSEEDEQVQPVGEAMNELADLESNHGASGNVSEAGDEEDEDDDDGPDEPTITFLCALSLLVFVTLAVAACSEFLVDSIQAVTEQWGMNESFVGIILIPIVGNAAEHATAVTVAMKNKMDLAIGVAIGSSTQIALFLIPFITLLGWIIHEPMSLNFSSFETICLVMAVLMVNFLVKNGESNWLQGVMLIAVYCIIATAFLFHPNTPDDPHAQNHSGAWQPPSDTAADAPSKHGF